MVEPADREFLNSIFLMEAWETVAALEDGAAAAARGELDALYVVTHRLKGAAALHGFPVVADLAAQLEAVLESSPFDAARLTLLLTELKSALDSLVGGGQALASAPGGPAPLVPAEPTDGAAGMLDDPVRRELADFFTSNADVASYFVPEATEHLEAITTALLALERGGGEEDLARLFRSMHTIKGAAYVVGCVRIGALAHRAEDLLVAVREGDATLSPPALEALFATVDVLKLMLGLTSNPSVSITAVAADVGGRLEALLSAAPGEVVEAPPEPVAPVAPPVEIGQTPSLLPTTPAARRRRLPSGAATRRVTRQTIRVNLERLDALMDLIGELVTGRSRVDRRLEELDRLSAALFASRARLAEAVTEFERRQLDPRRVAAARPTEDPPVRIGQTGLSVGEMFAELEFDRYDDAGMFARSIAEIASDIAELQAELVAVNRKLRDDTAHVHRLTTAIRSEIGRARLVPIGNLFTRFVRQGKEAARAGGKQVRIETLGETVELDTSVIEQIVDPLLHLVQNAIAHGIESADERRALGKSPIGAVTLSASHQGGAVVLEVADDGRGIDPDLVRRRAVARGFVAPDTASAMTDREAIDLIFLPGFTTATAVTTASGRGVGMDVVRTNVRRLNGEIDVTSTMGEGTRFTLRLPLTVLVSEALLVRAGGEMFAVALNSVQLVTALPSDQRTAGSHGETVTVGDKTLEVVSLAAALGLPETRRGPRRPALVLRAGGRVLAVEVDEVLHKQDIVIKPLGDFLEGAGPYAGATVTADGRVVLLLDAVGVAERAATTSRGERSARAASGAPVSVGAPARKRVLLVDDSISVRRFVGQMLEKAGFDVTTAADGADAITRLADGTFDVLVTDLEMPRVNGYELIDDLRRRPSTRTLPVIVLTTRAGDKHVALARQLGVDHYVTKPVEEQTFVSLVTTVARG